MAVPEYQGGNVMKFTAADQEYAGPFRINAVAWVNEETSGRDIAASDDLLLVTPNAEPIVGKRAYTHGDGLVVSFPGDGVRVSGLRSTTIDGGVLWVYGAK